jgi:hypothetical protein
LGILSNFVSLKKIYWKMNSVAMKNLFLLPFCLFISLMGYAQTGTVKGFVYEKSSIETPLPFVNVKIKDTDMGAATNDDGYFQILQVPAGNYVLEVSSIGYQTEEIEIQVNASATVNKKIYLKEGKELDAIDVTSEYGERVTTIRMSQIKATPKDVMRVPTIGGESDLATYFQTLPGVVTTGDQGGQLYVRGGAPIQNKVMLDGMVIYNPFHSIGFFSVFDTDIIRSADIYTGGFNAEYGGRISSVMDISTRDGNKNEFAGKISVSPFGAKLLLEGPIKKPVTEGGSSISYLFSGKTSYLAQTSKVFYPYVNDDGAGLPFNFTDLFGKVSFNGTNGSKFSLFGFNFTDSVKYQSLSDLKWNTFGVGSTFLLVPQASPVLVMGNFSYSKYAISLDDQSSKERMSEVDGFNLGFDFKYYLQRDEVKYGIGIQGFRTNFQTYNSVDRIISQTENTTELNAYINYKLTRGKFLMEAGLRGQYYASLATFSPEPRLGMKLNVNETLRFKFSTGIYSQNLISANSDRDVVNLFYGFLSGSDDLPDTYLNDELEIVERKHPLQKSIHYILGAEYDLGEHFTFNLEGYFKDFTQLTNINRNKIYDESDATKPDLLKYTYIIETGDAKGVDLLVKYSSKKTFVWFVYSLMKATRWDGIQEYAPVFDRRHNINFVFTQLFGEKDAWEVNVRWNFGTGLPFTQTGGYYMNMSFDELSGDYTTANSNDLSIIYSDLNKGRLSDYHRLDFSMKRRFEFTEEKPGGEGLPNKEVVKSRLEIILGVTNVYNRQNIFYVDRVSGNNGKVYQLPIIPTIGFNWAF